MQGQIRFNRWRSVSVSSANAVATAACMRLSKPPAVDEKKTPSSRRVCCASRLSVGAGTGCSACGLGENPLGAEFVADELICNTPSQDTNGVEGQWLAAVGAPSKGHFGGTRLRWSDIVHRSSLCKKALHCQKVAGREQRYEIPGDAASDRPTPRTQVGGGVGRRRDS
jgi:hypothetical protein